MYPQKPEILGGSAAWCAACQTSATWLTDQTLAAITRTMGTGRHQHLAHRMRDLVRATHITVSPSARTRPEGPSR